MRIKIDEQGVLRTASDVASPEVKSVEIIEDLPKLLSDAEELTKDVILASRDLSDEILKYSGITIKVAKTEEEKEKKDIEKAKEKHEKSLDDGVEGLDSLIEELSSLIKRIEKAIKSKGSKVKPSELKDSDRIMNESSKAIDGADSVLEEADETMLKNKMKDHVAPKMPPKKEEMKEEKMEDKKSALNETEMKNANEIVDKSTVISDDKKAAVKAKISMAENNDAAKQILTEAGEKFASENGSKTMEKKAETMISNVNEKSSEGDYGISKSKDQATAKSEFAGNDKTIDLAQKMDKKMIVNATERLSNNKLAKFKKALDLGGEAQLKGIVEDPLKMALIKSLTEAGVSQKIASTCVENAYIDSKQESIEQLVKRAEELYDLDNIRFVEAKVTINKYVPGMEKVADKTDVKSVNKTASVVVDKQVSTVVSGVGSEQASGDIDYKSLFNKDRPLGAI